MQTILSLNVGSSSIKYALFDATTLKEIERGTDPNFKNYSPNIIVHRFVYCSKESAFTQKITKALIEEIKTYQFLDPQHLPKQLKTYEQLASLFPKSLSIACFDSEFHKSIPEIARMLPLPKEIRDLKVEKYGFHGISYEYLLEALHNKEGDSILKERIVMAHLGSGSSLCAINKGISIDTTMSFTPTSGIPMSTRCGDLDPEILLFLLKKGYSQDTIHELLNQFSGLKGLSGKTGDLKELIEEKQTFPIDYFCYSIQKQIGAYVAALKGIDRVIFSGGIGENSSLVREKICRDLEFLGIKIDNELNKNNKYNISCGLPVNIIPTNEEWMMAKKASRLLNE